MIIKGSRIPSKLQFKKQCQKLSASEREVMARHNLNKKSRKRCEPTKWMIFARSKMEWVNMNALTTTTFEYPEVQQALGY
tara:strand:- start:1841 stop:2080 length:240 start_codon:yes stop_codon:yes gene_type:complete